MKSNKSTKCLNFWKALKQVESYWKEEPPVSLDMLAEDLNLGLYKTKSLPAGYHGMIRKEPDKGKDCYKIYVNADHPIPVRRFTAAHEIAHFMLHRKDIGDGIFDDALYLSGLSGKKEREANLLASYLLVPTELLRKEIRNNGPLDVAVLAAKFKVPSHVMFGRLAPEAWNFPWALSEILSDAAGVVGTESVV